MSKFLAKILPSETAARRLADKVTMLGPKQPGPTLLVMNRAVLSSDIRAVAARSNLNFASVSAAKFEALTAGVVPKPDQTQTFFNPTYWTGPAERRAKLKAITRAFLDRVDARIGFDAVVVANTDYWQDEAVKDACRDMGKRFIVLCRENYAVPLEQKLLHDRIADAGFTFEGDVVAVASDITRETMQAAGAFKPDSVHTIGWPRFDSWLDAPKTAAEDRKLITLVAYQEPLYLAPKNFDEVLKAFVATAKASGEPGRFCIKLKKMGHMRALLKACPSLLLSGVKIHTKHPLDDLLRRSSAVVGYNTTGILEGYLTDCAVIVPWWADAPRTHEDCLVTKDTDLDLATTYFPESAEALQTLISDALAAKLPPRGTDTERIEQFQRFIWFDREASASARFEAVVHQVLAA
jgi:hypothetical protein